MAAYYEPAGERARSPADSVVDHDIPAQSSMNQTYAVGMPSSFTPFGRP